MLPLQHGGTFVLISSWLITLLRATAGLLRVPFTSDNIPIVFPRSPFWLTHSGPNGRFPDAKATTGIFLLLLLLFLFFFPSLCV